MPGRGYLQVGNENIELIQMAYTGEDYEYAEDRKGANGRNFTMWSSSCATNCWKKNAPRTPWPPFLPTKLTLSSQLVSDYMPDDAGNYEQTVRNLGYRGEEILPQPGDHRMDERQRAVARC
jgi:S-DNA-T family DNA segregation ATPase FtsK/SpoIIIE